MIAGCALAFCRRGFREFRNSADEIRPCLGGAPTRGEPIQNGAAYQPWSDDDTVLDPAEQALPLAVAALNDNAKTRFVSSIDRPAIGILVDLNRTKPFARKRHVEMAEFEMRPALANSSP